ncbi:hypothetical protein F5Y15DRAFT_382156 [Xylariaceae sp. FL0016]|nr:hypothetical protein F5Y15DRAFT_382156 [Xylariaceae sp. FL0016]
MRLSPRAMLAALSYATDGLVIRDTDCDGLIDGYYCRGPEIIQCVGEVTHYIADCSDDGEYCSGDATIDPPAAYCVG